MNKNPVPSVILMAEDDEDDYLLAREAFAEVRLLNQLFRVRNGEEVMDFLLHHGAFTDAARYPRPSLILLDLNMPRMDGREVLAHIKSHEDLRTIPVVVLTTSQSEEDILRSYQLGVNSFIRKPVTFSDFVDVISVLKEYWFELVDLPPSRV